MADKTLATPAANKASVSARNMCRRMPMSARGMAAAAVSAMAPASVHRRRNR
jgi:hypothetical protein